MNMTVPLPENLPAHAAMALYEVLSHLSEALWRHYEPALLELIMRECNQSSHSQLALDFDDDPPF